MDKKFSRIFLVAVIVVLFLIGIFLIINNKEEVNIEDISGDRSYLEDITIIYQKRKGLYETDEIQITKDNEEINKFVKEGAYNLELTQENIENRNLFFYLNYRNQIFEDENEIGIVDLTNSYLSYDNSVMIAYVDIKNKKNKKIESYEINVDDYIDANGNTMYTVLPIKDNDNIYLAVISSIYSDKASEKNHLKDDITSTDCYSETYLSLYKLNLNTKKSKLVVSKSYDGKEINIDSNIGFVRGDTAYFIINNNKESESKSFTTTLFGFNIKNKDITMLDLGVNNSRISDYYLDGKEVLLSFNSHIKTGEMETVTVNLDKNKVVNRNNIEVRANSKDNRYTIAMSRQKNKTYLILGDYRYDEYIEYGNGYPDINYYIYVIDEKTNKVLYKGKITEKLLYDIKFGILKKDEK